VTAKEGAPMPTTDTTPSKETWADWLADVGDGSIDPTDSDDEVITRDELLRRAAPWVEKVHPRTLQILEQQGLLPRPIRRWHGDAVRALYAPWMTDLVVRAYDHYRNHSPLEEAQADMRRYVLTAYFGYHMHRDSQLRIPEDTLNQLRALAYRHTRFHAPVAAVEIRFMDADGEIIAAHHHDYSDQDFFA